MGRSSEERITPELARQVCAREGIKAVLNGPIASIGNQFVVGVDAVNCQTGDSLAREQMSVEKKEQVLAAVGKAASSLRGKLGESLSSIQKFDKPVEEATTSSLEALKAFSLGEIERAKGSEFTSIPFYKHAIELDPNFAIAYAKLGQAYANLLLTGLGVENTQKAFQLRDRASELEKLYITSHYHDVVTGDLDKSNEIYQLWKRTYPRDGIPSNNLASAYTVVGRWEQALAEAQETTRQDPNDAHSYSNLGAAYFGLDRLAEGKAVRLRSEDLKLDFPEDHRDLYLAASAEGDSVGMQRELDWSKGKPNEFVMLGAEGELTALAGKLQKARDLYREAVDSAQRAKFEEQAALLTAQLATTEALFGDVAQSRDRALRALAINRSRFPAFNAGIALALAGDARASKIADDLAQQFPSHTIIRNIFLPIIRAALELNHGDASKTIDSLEPTKAYEFGFAATVVPNYLRGQAYLQQKKAKDAEAEFQKILSHRFLCANSTYCAVTRLQLGRTYALEGDSSKARTAYQDFLALWKDADPDIPLLKAAKAEYAKLQ